MTCQCLFCLNKQLKPICSFSVYIPAEFELFKVRWSGELGLVAFAWLPVPSWVRVLQSPMFCLTDALTAGSFCMGVSGFLKSLRRV